MQQLVAGGDELVGRRLHGLRSADVELDADLGNGEMLGHSSVPKHAWAAWASGQIPKCFEPGTASLCR